MSTMPPKPSRPHPFPTPPLSRGAMHLALSTGKPSPEDLRSAPENALTMKMFCDCDAAARGFQNRATVRMPRRTATTPQIAPPYVL